jgi:hypothetical protein
VPTFLNHSTASEVRKKLLGQWGRYQAFLVDGEAVRHLSPTAQEFGGSAISTHLPGLIPADEIWIEDSTRATERQAMLVASLWELEALRRGLSAEEAYAGAVRKERQHRDSLRLAQRYPQATNSPAPKHIYVAQYGRLPNITAWLVRGDRVRNEYRVEWIEGGHGYVYPWIPNNEIWLEFGLHESELPLILLHEYAELALMRRQFGYEQAHARANKVEFHYRQKGLTRQQALRLTEQRVLQLAQLFG